LAAETTRLSELKAAHVTELLKFLGKAPLPEATNKALQDAEEMYAIAVDAAGRLTAADVQVLSEMLQPSSEIVSVVEAACIVLGVTPDYDTARQKLLSFPYLPESILTYDKSNVPANVIKQLQRRSAVSLPADDLPCVTALNTWIKCLLQLDALSDDIATERAKLSVSPAIQSLSLAACEIFGIGGLDEDLMEGLKLAEAVLKEEQQGTTQQTLTRSSAEEEKLEEEITVLDDRLSRLDQFKKILTENVETLESKLQPAQDEMTTLMLEMSEKNQEVKMELQKPLESKLSVGDGLIQDSCMILSLMLASDRGAPPADICLQLLSCDTPASLAASTKTLSARVMDGNVIMEHFEQVLMLSERIEETIKFDCDGSLDNIIKTTGGKAFVKSVGKLVSCFQISSELAQTSAQLMAMQEDRETTATRQGLPFISPASYALHAIQYLTCTLAPCALYSRP
jgi:hypothetical protein